MSVVAEPRASVELASGVTVRRMQAGGKDGPKNVVLDSDQLGGGLWSELLSLGYPGDPWRMAIPDVRMARNQLWPIHWHNCWIAVVVLDGSCLIGDWWMKAGDVLISPAKVEYGPVLNGPKGCQMLEIFARDVLSVGGYGREYHDHPTLSHLQTVKMSGADANFAARPSGDERNRDHQTTPLADLPGVLTGHLSGGHRWDLGEQDDPERGVLLDSKLPGGVEYPPHRHQDWRAALVLDGGMTVGGRELSKDDWMIVEPKSEVPSFKVGPDGVHLLEAARTIAAVPRIFDESYRTAPGYSHLLHGENIFE